jgi:hypothetical protein
MHPVTAHQLHNLLQRFGGSLPGAQQVLRGDVIMNPADRRALAILIRALLQSHTQELLRSALCYQKIAWQYDGKQGWSDDWH